MSNAIMFSCTIAPAAESYTIHLLLEEQNGQFGDSLRLPYYFTQGIVYNFLEMKSTILLFQKCGEKKWMPF